MASHVLCDCEALETLRFRHLGCHFISGDLDDTSISRILHFAQGVGLVNAEHKSCTKDWKWLRCKGHCGGCHTAFYSMLHFKYHRRMINFRIRMTGDGGYE